MTERDQSSAPPGASTPGEVTCSGRVRARDLCWVALILAVVLPWPLRFPPIYYHGEAREALVVESILANESWGLPYRNGELPSKPPLFHWIAAAMAHIVPMSDATARAPSAIGSWAMASAILVLGGTVSGRASGWLAVGALFGMEPIWESASQARVDMVFAACLTIAMAGFYLWYQRRRAWQRLLCFLGVALAALAKGPVGAALAAMIILGFLTLEGRLRLVRDLLSWPLAAAAVITGGWYAFAWHAGGEAFLTKQIMNENLNRFLGTGPFADPARHGSPFKLALVLFSQILPWSLLLLWEAYRRLRGQSQDAFGRFLHTWWIAVLLFFSVSAAKRNIYLLPAYPAVALIAGRAMATMLMRFPGSDSDQRSLGVWVGAPPAPLRRGVVVLAVAAVVAFDFAMLGGLQAVRTYRARRDSLVPFAADVQRRLPPAASLYASPDLSETDLLVLAYRLRRDIKRKVVEPSRGEFFLVRRRDLPSLLGADYATVSLSRRRRANVALVTATGAMHPGGRLRGDAPRG